MAVDKLVDSGKLDAALAYEASKIIAKGGGTAPLAFDLANEKGFGDYIDAIPSGGGGDVLHFSGKIVINNVQTKSITVPISGITLTSSMIIVGLARATKTGVVSSGEITWNSTLKIPAWSTSNTTWWCPTFASYKMSFPTNTIYNSGGTSQGTKSAVESRAYRMHNSNSGGTTGGAAATIDTVNNSVTIGSGSDNYSLCRAGSAVEYEYCIFIMGDDGTAATSMILED